MGQIDIVWIQANIFLTWNPIDKLTDGSYKNPMKLRQIVSTINP